MNKWYFGYGMNTNIKGMRYRCPNATWCGPAVLDNHKFVFRHHADIEQSPTDQVQGVLWHITEDCERSLDTLEGYPYYYNKKEVIVESREPVNGMNKFIAMVYYMNDQSSVELPGKQYLDSLLEGYKENFISTDQIYQALAECRQNEQNP